ncbi:hypothetical protein [Leptospira weilii]
MALLSKDRLAGRRMRCTLDKVSDNAYLIINGSKSKYIDPGV